MADFASCCAWSILFIIGGSYIGFPIASIYLGTTYQDDCPLDPLIPDFLITLGAITLGPMLVTIVKGCVDEDECCAKLLSLVETLLNLFIVAWTCAGLAFYISDKDKRSGDASSPYFCHYTLWAYFCSQVIMAMILMAFILLVFILGCATACCCAGDDDDHEAQPRLATISRSQTPVVYQQRATIIQRVNVSYYYQQILVVAHPHSIET